MGSTDVLIIGGGSAGARLAERLSADPKRSVVLLERGMDFANEAMPPELRHPFMADASTAPGCPSSERGAMLRALSTSNHMEHFHGHKRGGFAIIPRGSVIGGSSSVNAGIYLWGTPEDYDHWAELGNPRWAYAQVRGAFAAIETDCEFPRAPHGDKGGVRVHRSPKSAWHAVSNAFFAAARDAGHPEIADFNDPDACPTGVGPTPFNVEGGVRYSAALAFLGPETRRRPNLRVIGSALVTRIVLEGKRAVGVAVDHNGEREIFRANEIVLSSGSVRSPQLLMLSGIGAPDQLKAHDIAVVHALPGVGENLQDHPCANLWWTLNEIPPLREPNGIEVSIRYTANGSPFRNDLQINCRMGNAVYDAAGLIERVDPRNLGLGAHLYRTRGTGTLRLTGTDPRMSPHLDYRYLEDDDDRARMRECVRHAFDLVATDKMRAFVKTPAQLSSAAANFTRKDADDDGKLDAWMFAVCATGQHTSSTCKMGPASDPLAVVDEYGRVHGLEHLRVIDSSIMPTCIRANTNAPSMMIGEHAASLMLSDNQI